MLLYIEPEAEPELDEAAQRYEDTVQGLGFEFLVEMRRRTDRCSKRPSDIHCSEGPRTFAARMPWGVFLTSSCTWYIARQFTCSRSCIRGQREPHAGAPDVLLGMQSIRRPVRDEPLRSKTRFRARHSTICLLDGTGVSPRAHDSYS